MLCFFPFVGFVIAAFETFLLFLRTEHFGIFFHKYEVYPFFFMLVPIFLTGAIHLDGFMDTCDALASHADREKKLEIMKDPHCGAFAVIACAVYLLCFLVMSIELVDRFCPVTGLSHYGYYFSLFLIFAVSRALSTLAVCIFPIAKDSGLLRTFSDASARRFTLIWTICLLTLLYATMILINGLRGLKICLVTLCAFAWYFFMSRRNFGGITGDTAGYFVQVCELVSLFAAL